MVYTDVSGKGPRRQLSVDRMIASGYLDNVVVNSATLELECVYLNLVGPPWPGDTDCRDLDPVQATSAWLSNLPCVYTYM